MADGQPDPTGPGVELPTSAPKTHKVRNVGLVILGSLAIIGAISAATSGGSDARSDHPHRAVSGLAGERNGENSQPKAEPKPELTVAQENAIESAESYLALAGFSRAGLIDQLSSNYGDGFSTKDAVFAVNHVDADWNAEAVESAESYLDIAGFSRAGLIDQLSSASGDQFTVAQATHAANQVGL